MVETISVLMAVYNQADTVAESIKSILSQTFSDFKLIIVDDKSADQTAAILAETAKADPRIQLIFNQAHLGLTRSLNKAIRISRGRYLARMDGDDLALPDRLQKQFDYLNTHPAVMLLGTAAYLINSQGKNLGLKRFPLDDPHIRKAILSYCPLIHPTWMLRRIVLKSVGVYNEAFPFAQDYELALRIISRFPVNNLPQPLISYRVDSAPAISIKHLKQQEFLALKARFQALGRHDYSYLESWKLIKPLLSFLLPAGIKRKIYQKLFWG